MMPTMTSHHSHRDHARSVDYERVRDLIAAKIRELGRPVMASEVSGAHQIAVGNTATKYKSSFQRVEAFVGKRKSGRWFIGFTPAIAAWEPRYDAFGHLKLEADCA